MTMPTVQIDEHSGFCHGVVSAINKAEEELSRGGELYCLGDIVHNNDEVERLAQKGLKTIEHDDFAKLSNVRVLLRAHGEPPETYATARLRGIELVDATCPVVLKLQQRIKKTYSTAGPDTQIVIYGKKGHAEVNGLVGQTHGRAIVVDSPEQLDKLDYSKPIELYSQTTKSVEGLHRIARDISQRMQPGVSFNFYDTICRQVENRLEHLRKFAGDHDVILFVSGAKSSNGRVLYSQCRQVNPRTYLLSSVGELDPQWLTDANSIGICGATSTPRWLMEHVRAEIFKILQKKNE